MPRARPRASTGHELTAPWLEMVHATIDAIYDQQLTPPGGPRRWPDPNGRAAYEMHCIFDGWTAEQIEADVRASEEWARVHAAPTRVVLPRLRVRGHCFELETGERWTAIECSDFNLWARYLAGEDITPVLKQRADIGFNLLRVWTLYDLEAANIGTLLDPDYTRLAPFLDLCAGYGLHVELTAFTSTERPEHWDHLVAAAEASDNPPLLELVNEEDQPVNRIDLGRYAEAAGLLDSHGSNGSQARPVEPFWDYATFHTNGASEEQRKIGHNAMEIWNGPVLTNETSRYPDVGMWAGQPLDRQRAVAFDSAAGAALLCAGSCFHSVSGKRSVLLTPEETEIAFSWVDGATSVDLAYQDGNYYHRTDLEGPGILRVYERRTSSGSAIVKIRS